MQELILITIFGQDRPYVTSTVTDILSSNNATVLDIGQSVIHETLSLGMLVAFSSGSDSGKAVKDILYSMHEKGMQVKFRPVKDQSYRDWVANQGKPRHIVSLLARQVTAAHIAELSRIVSDSGLNIDNISRLSGRIPLEGDQKKANACVEFSARGHPRDIASLRAQLSELASSSGIDIAFQEDNMYRRTRRLVCFDMDSTLIESEVIDELAKAAGVGQKVVEITHEAMSGNIDFDESFRRRVALIKGLDTEVLQTIAEQLSLTEGAERLVKTLKDLGYKTAILSGGFQYFGEYIQSKLGIDYVFANHLDVDNGKVTGNVSGQIVNGERKAALLRELADKENISLEQVVAVGDGANDLPMLSIAGLGIAFRAKPLVRAEAEQAISNLGLDAILYLMGFRDREIGD